MKVFISWSGDRSRHVAQALRDWLPKVLQGTKPWMSDKDIDAGRRWSAQLSAELENSKVGILCVTPENQQNAWLMFEAGALAKSVSETRLVPYLYKLQKSDLLKPAADFQAVLADREGTRKLVDTLNDALDEGMRLATSVLDEVFATWWEKLEEELRSVSPGPVSPPSRKRSSEDILSEVLQNTRQLLRQSETIQAVIAGSVIATGENTMIGVARNAMIRPNIRKTVLLDWLDHGEGKDKKE